MGSVATRSQQPELVGAEQLAVVEQQFRHRHASQRAQQQSYLPFASGTTPAAESSAAGIPATAYFPRTLSFSSEEDFQSTFSGTPISQQSAWQFASGQQSIWAAGSDSDDEDMALAKPLFSGREGQDWDQFRPFIVNRCLDYQRKAKDSDKEDPAAWILQIELMLQLQSMPHQLVVDLCELPDMGRLIEEAALGYFPSGLPSAVRALVKPLIRIVTDKDGYIDAVFEAQLGKIIRAAQLAGRLGSHPDAQAYQQKRRPWHMPPPVGAPAADMEQAAAARVAAESLAGAAQPHSPLQVGVMRLSPAAALGYFLLCLIEMVCKAPDQQQLDKWRKMSQEGQQGSLSLPDWYSDVQRQHAKVSSHPEVSQHQEVRTFIRGLNAQDDKAVPLRQQMLDWHRDHGTASLQEALHHVTELQQQQHQYFEDNIRLQLCSAVSSSSGAAGSSSKSSSSRLVLPEGHTLHPQLTDQQVEDQLSSMYKSGQLQKWDLVPDMVRGYLQTAVELGPGKPNAICQRHGFVAGSKPHTNLQCPDQQREKEAQKAKRQQRYRTGGHYGGAAQRSSGSNSKSDLEQLADHLTQQFGAMLQATQSSSSMPYQAAAGLGLPRQVPKAAEPYGGRPQQQQQRQAPCPWCNFVYGHDEQACYLCNPAKAHQERPSWAPGDSVPQHGLQRYLQACANANITPKLHKARHAVQHLLDTGGVPQQLQPMVRRALDTSYRGAAGQYWQPQQLPPQPQPEQWSEWQPWPAPALPAPVQLQQPLITYPNGAGGQPAAMAGQQQQPAVPPPPGSGGAGYGYQPPPGGFGGFFQAAVGQLHVPGCHTVQQLEQAQEWQLAAAGQRSSKRLHNPAELVSFRPAVELPAADGNTAAGGRSQPPAASPVSMQATDQVATQLVQEYNQLHKRFKQFPSAAELAELTAAAASQAATLSRNSSPAQQCSASLSAAAYPRLLFNPGPVNLAALRSGRRCMHKVLQPAGDAATVRIYTGELQRALSSSGGSSAAVPLPGSSIKPTNVAEDNGANLLLFTQQFCRQHGISVNYGSSTAIKHIDGVARSTVVGRTEPITIVLGEQTLRPLVVAVPEGAYVLTGDAGGLYEVCLDSNTLSRWGAFTNPAWGHLCWYPDADSNDFSSINGIPVAITQPLDSSTASTAQHQPLELVAAAASHPQMREMLKKAALLQRDMRRDRDSSSAAAAQQHAAASDNRAAGLQLSAASGSCSSGVSVPAAVAQQQAATASALSAAGLSPPAAGHYSIRSNSTASTAQQQLLEAVAAVGCSNKPIICPAAAAGQQQAATTSDLPAAGLSPPAAAHCSSGSSSSGNHHVLPWRHRRLMQWEQQHKAASSTEEQQDAFERLTQDFWLHQLELDVRASQRHAWAEESQREQGSSSNFRRCCWWQRAAAGGGMQH